MNNIALHIVITYHIDRFAKAQKKLEMQEFQHQRVHLARVR